MTTQDIRWEQRFSNFRKALRKFRIAVEFIKESIFDDLGESETISEIEIDDDLELKIEGLIQRFEYTHELAWKVLSDYAKYQGFQDIKGSKDATRYGLQHNLINSEIWMEMIMNRNRTSHTYDEDTAQEIVEQIYYKYAEQFDLFEAKMSELVEGYVQQQIF